VHAGSAPPPVAKEPAGQAAAAVAPSTQKLPAGHCVHVALAAAAAKVPAGQGEHDVAPAALHAPAAHSVITADPTGHA
jgi:hypothetical protein